MTAKRTGPARPRGGAGKAPEGYDPASFPPFAVTVDVVILTLVDQRLSTLLIRRGGEPHQGAWALPGGFVLPDEGLLDAAKRELREETGVEAADHLEQLGAYGDPDRDPRMRVVTVAYLAVLRAVRNIAAGSDAAHAELIPVADILNRRKYKLAFDHRRILEDAVDAVRTKLEHTALATAFVGPEFTLSELRNVYETTWGTELDPGNFRRKILSEEGLVEPTGRTKPPGHEGGKPAAVYKRGKTSELSSPLRVPKKP